MTIKNKRKIHFTGLILFSFLILISIISHSTITPVQFDSIPINNFVYRDDVLIHTAKYGSIEDLTVSKAEIISAEFNAIGELLKSTTQIIVEIQNNHTNNVTFDFFDRVEGGTEVNPSKETLEYGKPNVTNEHGLLLLNWSRLKIDPDDSITLNYIVEQDKELPVNVSVNYMIDGIPTDPIREDSSFKLETPLKSNLTISLTLKNNGEGLFVSTDTVQPISIAMVTLALPLETLGEPRFTTPPIISNEISGVNQISFAVLLGEDPVTLNVTTQILEGGGWGLLELEPLRIDIVRSPEMFYALISAINAMLGLVTGLEGYWAYLTIESMLDQVSMMTPLLELLVDILMTDFTVFNTILNTLVHIEGYTIFQILDSMINGPGLIRNLIALENMRGILNSSTLLGYPFGEDLLLDELDLIENSTVQAIGSQLLALLGSPVDIELYNFSLAENNTWDSSQFTGNLTAIAVSNDLDENGISEIIVAYNWTQAGNDYTSIEIFQQQGDQYVSIWNSPPLNGTVANNCIGTGDFDQDNNRELVVGMTNNDGKGNLTIFEFNTTFDLSKYEIYNIIFANGGISSILAENGLNLDNDTNDEFVIALNNGSIYIINGSWDSGTINLTIKWSTIIDGICYTIAHGDTDQDTREEILCSNNTQISLFENTSLGFKPLKNLTNHNYNLITGDSDSDNNLEIITSNETWINIFEPNISTTIIEDPDPTKTIIIRTLEGYTQTAAINISSSISNATHITNLIMEDFDMDEKMEIVAASENGSIFFYESIGNNKYDKILEYNLNTTGYGIKKLTSGDVDNDGYSDIIIMGADDKFHIILRPFDIYDLNVRIYANLTVTGLETLLYVKIELQNVYISYPPRVENLTYIYNGTGPSLFLLTLNVIENTTSISDFLTNVSQEISAETTDPLSGVVGVWDRTQFNYTTGLPLDGAINLYNPVPGNPLLKGTYKDNNITFKLPIGHPVDLVANYSFYIIPDPLFGLNITTIPPYEYSFPGQNQTLPAIYPFIAHLFDIRTSPLIELLGNITMSLSKQILILNSTISPDIGPYKPIVFLSQFDLLGLFSSFSEMLNVTSSPFEPTPALDIPFPTDMPIDTDLLTQLGNFEFLTRLKIFTDPRIHSRFVTNITIREGTSALNQILEILSLQSFLGLEDFTLFQNYTQYSDLPKGLNLKPILINDINNDGENDTIVAVNGFYPMYEIRALNSSNNALLWDYRTEGPIINMSFDGNNIIRASVLNIDNQWLMANESQNSTIYTQEIIENQTSIDNLTVEVRFNISTYEAQAVIGVWNRSEFNFTTNQTINPSITNYYNESAGAYFVGRTIHLSTNLTSNQTELVINYIKKSPTIITMDYYPKTVIGVWNESDLTGIDYFPGGSINGKNITLGRDLDTPNATVFVKYYYYSNASSFTYLLNYSGDSIDSRENLLNETQFFNGTVYINHTYIGPDLGIIQTPIILNCSSVLKPNYYLLLIFTEQSIYAINGTLETSPELRLLFNNTNNQNKEWEISSSFIGSLFQITDIENDGNKELIHTDFNGVLFSYDLTNGTILWNVNQRLGMVSNLDVKDINNDGIKEIIVGSTNNKIYLFNGTDGEFIWSFEADGPINDVAIEDLDGDGNKEIIVASEDNNIYSLNRTNGQLLWSYNITGNIKSIAIGDMTNDSLPEIIIGSDENLLYCLNVTDTSNISILWTHEISGQIPVFQFFTTPDSITLQWDLSDRLFEMMYEDLDEVIGGFMGGGMDMSLGIDSILDLGLDGMDINLEDLADVNLPTGIGLFNLIVFQLQTVMALDELGQVTLAQREFTGKPEVRDIGDTPNIEIIQKNTSAFIDGDDVDLTWFEIYNNDSIDLLRLNYFAVILKEDNYSIQMNQCRFYMWNGADYINILDNEYYNMTLDMLKLIYDNNSGELRFKPFIEIDPFEQVNASIDWKGRTIFLEVRNDTGPLNITYWADISIIHPKVTYEIVTTTISYSITYPVFQVETIKIPFLPLQPPEATMMQKALSDPLFYIIFIVFFALIVEWSYLRKRESYTIQRLAYKNLITWLKGREKSWKALLKKGKISSTQYNRLRNLRSRLGEEVRPRWYTDECLDKLSRNTFLDMSFSTLLLLPFWRKLGRPNRLAQILDNMFSAVFSPSINAARRSGSWIKKKIKGKPKKRKKKKDKLKVVLFGDSESFNE
ncbi:MAG: FG-GAP-like repeat-containing protein [Promethearchaeota archaeon]